MMLYIFDMGGVLVQSFDVLPEAARRLGLSETAARQFARTDMDALMTGAMNLEDYWRRFEAASGVRVTEDYWTTLFAPTLDAGMDRLVRSLHSTGRVVCGTNTVGSHYDYLTKHGMYGCFDAVYASHLMGVCKPDPAFWLAILESEGVAARDVFFIDDYPENTEAAELLDIRSHRFNGMEGLKAALSNMLVETELKT
jgi:putative hydrolase of the HAD superfamily